MTDSKSSPIAQFHWLPHTWGIAFGIVAAVLYDQSPILTCAIMGWSIFVFIRENAMFERSFIQAHRGAVLTNDGEEANVMCSGEIQSILVEQSLVGRIFGFGSIVFVDHEGRRRAIGPVRNPHAFRATLLMNL